MKVAEQRDALQNLIRNQKEKPGQILFIAFHLLDYEENLTKEQCEKRDEHLYEMMNKIYKLRKSLFEKVSLSNLSLYN